MSVFSKYLVSVPYNCYELGHTWTPFCSQAVVEVGVSSFKKLFRMYALLYLVSQAYRRKFNSKDFLQTLQNTTISTVFLTFNITAFIGFLCLMRRMTGRFHYLQCFILTPIFSNLIAIHLERKNRRKALALYTMNVASDTAYRMLVWRGVIKPVPSGAVFMFCLAMGVIMYSMRKDVRFNDISFIAIRKLFGFKTKAELAATILPDPKEELTDKAVLDQNFNIQRTSDAAAEVPGRVSTFPLAFLGEEIPLPSHPSCPHFGSCFHHFLQGCTKPGALGLAVSLVLKLSSNYKLFVRPDALLAQVFSLSTLRLPLFLAGFSGTYRGLGCLLRWITGEDQAWHTFVAAFLAGGFIKLYPFRSLALYLTWKWIEMAYEEGMKSHKLPRIPGAVPLLYTVSGTVILYCFIFEPHNLKPSYLRFINDITENRLRLINRLAIEVIGASSKQYGDFFPDLDVRYCTRQFIENVLVWMIR